VNIAGTAYERLVDALRDHNVLDKGNTARARCPVHNGISATSLSLRAIDGSVLVKCQAECQTKDVLAALNMQMCDLYDNRRGAEYVYPDGRRVYRQVTEVSAKSFYQKANPENRALFHSDRIGDAQTVYVPEGEKDVLAIEAAGGAAVCNAMGAGKAHKFDWTPLRGKSVVIVADKDEPGRKHARQVAELLTGVAASVRTVEAAVGKDAADHIAAGKGLDEFVEPEPEPRVDGAELLDDVEHFARRFLAFPSAHYFVALVLWIAHTWAMAAWYVTPRLVLDSPEPGSGKTRVLEILALLCQGAKLTLSTTTAALYRRIEAAGDRPPTVLADEADAVFSAKTPQSEDLRALYNSGYKRGATVDRCEGDAKNMKVREFRVYAPVAMAFLGGRVPRSITDRAVTMHMRRRAPDEHVDEYRERDATTEAAPMKRRLENWATVNFDALAGARPAMPEGVRDRPAECWEPLLSIADLAGGDWPERARAACRHFVLNSDPDELSFGARLLRDVQIVFGDRDRMFSADIVATLVADDESEWSDLWGKPLDQKRLAKELKRYGVRSNTIRIGDGRAKGYHADGDDGLGQAWRRYLPDASVRDNRYHRDIAGQRVTDVTHTEFARDTRDMSVTSKMAPHQPLWETVTAVTDVTPVSGTPTNGPPDGALFGPPSANGEVHKCDCGNQLLTPPAIWAGRCKPCRDRESTA
jgi:hypothetical protein